MSGCLSVTKICIVLVILDRIALGRPQTGNETKSRILTYPSKIDYGQEQDIIFPDDSEERVDFVSRLGGNPKCLEDLSFCEDVDAYPYNHLKKVLQQNPMFKILFGQDEVPQEIANRIGDEKETFVCRSYSKTIFPKIGKNKNDKWKFIINQGEDDGFIQGVQIEVCKNLEGECDFPGSLSLASGYQTYCKQKFVYRRLLSVNNKGAPEPDTFKLPSACCCAYKQTFDFLSRLGREQTPVSKPKS